MLSLDGSIAINLISGSTLPTLYFHDEESRSFSTSPISPPISQTASGSGTASSYPPRILDSGSRAPGLTTTWGGEDLLARLRQYAHILRSNLQSTLFLVDPSKADIETHTMQLFDDDAVDDILARSSYANSYPQFPLTDVHDHCLLGVDQRLQVMEVQIRTQDVLLYCTVLFTRRLHRSQALKLGRLYFRASQT